MIKITVMKRRFHPLIGLSFIALIMLFCYGVVSQNPGQQKNSEVNKPEQEKSNDKITKKKVVIPQYSVLDEEVYDAPVKTQVTLNVLVSGNISEPGLRALLNQLYNTAKDKKDFEYHDSPTNIYIYAFTSREKAESGMGQWIAMLDKSYDDKSPAISINELQIAELTAKAEERFGLSEKKRKEIYKEAISAGRRARIEAEKEHPIDPTQSLRAGQVYQLTNKTPLMPELEPADPIEAMRRVKQLPPNVTIKVLSVSMKQNTPWYQVEAKGPSNSIIGTGWINSIALMGQGVVKPKEQLRKQAELMDQLRDKYKNELAQKYGLTREQLEAITTEGLEKDWAFPN